MNGRMRKLLVHMNKSGVTFVLDRATGEFVGVFSVPELQTWISGVTEDGKLVGRREPELGKTMNFCPDARGREELERDGVLAAHRIDLHADARDLRGHYGRASAGGRRPILHERKLEFEAAAESRDVQSRGCVGSGDAEAGVELSVQIRAAGVDAGDGGRPGVHRQSGRRILRAGCAHAARSCGVFKPARGIADRR